MKKEYFPAIHQLITTGHWITDQVSQVLKEYEVTEPQYNVLRILSEAGGGPIAVQDILEKMVQRSSNVTRICDKLLAKGYVNRAACPTNRRKMDITLTAEGEKLPALLDKKVFELHEPFMGNLSEAELKTLKDLIIKLKTKHSNE